MRAKWAPDAHVREPDQLAERNRTGAWRLVRSATEPRPSICRGREPRLQLWGRAGIPTGFLSALQTTEAAM